VSLSGLIGERPPVCAAGELLRPECCRRYD
jgi:hypothetical protein